MFVEHFSRSVKIIAIIVWIVIYLGWQTNILEVSILRSSWRAFMVVSLQLIDGLLISVVLIVVYKRIILVLLHLRLINQSLLFLFQPYNSLLLSSNCIRLLLLDQLCLL